MPASRTLLKSLPMNGLVYLAISQFINGSNPYKQNEPSCLVVSPFYMSLCGANQRARIKVWL